MSVKIYLQECPHAMRMDMYIIEEKADGKRFAAQPTELVFKEMPEYAAIEPTLRFDHIRGSEFLRQLSEALASCGYKVDTSQEKGELKATKYHLEDMRKLVLKDKESKPYEGHPQGLG